jgi:hypothetical protein
MFWNKKKQETSADKLYNLRLNLDKQAAVNIIRLQCPNYTSESQILETALCLGLKIMEDLGTHQAEYHKIENNRKTQIVLPSQLKQ